MELTFHPAEENGWISPRLPIGQNSLSTAYIVLCSNLLVDRALNYYQPPYPAEHSRLFTMDAPDLDQLLSALAGNIDDLEASLRPILTSSVAKASSKLPLLDKAKMHVLMSYTIESIIFSSLRLSNVDAKSHPVFTELARVRQYFDKLKEAEAGPSKRENMSLDKAAAGRIIRHALAGNDRLDQERDAATARGLAATEGRQEDLDTNMTKSEVAATSIPTAGLARSSSSGGAGRKRKNANDMWDDQASSTTSGDPAMAARKSGKRSSSKRTSIDPFSS